MVSELNQSAESNVSKGEIIYEKDETLSSPGAGNTYILPDGAGKFTAWLAALIIDGEGSGYIETSISPRADIIAGRGNFIQWSKGTITSSDGEAFNPVVAVRAINVSGIIKLENRVV